METQGFVSLPSFKDIECIVSLDANEWNHPKIFIPNFRFQILDDETGIRQYHWVYLRMYGKYLDYDVDINFDFIFQRLLKDFSVFFSQMGSSFHPQTLTCFSDKTNYLDYAGNSFRRNEVQFSPDGIMLTRIRTPTNHVEEDSIRSEFKTIVALEEATLNYSGRVIWFAQPQLDEWVRSGIKRDTFYAKQPLSALADSLINLWRKTPDEKSNEFYRIYFPITNPDGQNEEYVESKTL